MNSKLDRVKATSNDSTKDCKQGAGVFIPVINRNKCEGKADCEATCAYDVFTIGVLPKDERVDLTLMGKVKGFGHGWKQSFVTNAELCHACGLCVQNCPNLTETHIGITNNIELRTSKALSLN